MKASLGLLVLGLGLPLLCQGAVGRDRRKLERGWSFQPDTQGLDPAPSKPGEACRWPQCMRKMLRDQGWRAVNLPHDFVVEGTVSREDGDDGHGYLPKGMGWYSTQLDLPADWSEKSIWLDFEGTQRQASIYLNGVLLGTHSSGYTSYRFNIGVGSSLNASLLDLKFGTSNNVLAVHIDARQPDGWWYDGGGLYRMVYLTAADPLHIKPDGVYVPGLVNPDSIEAPADGVGLIGDAVVKGQVSIVHSAASGTAGRSGAISVENTLMTSSGKEVMRTQAAFTVKSGSEGVFNFSLQLRGVTLWSPDTPVLYQMRTALKDGDETVDEVITTFGFRHIRFDGHKGFFLNGVSMKIKGMCNHQDFAGVGAAVPDSLQDYRVLRMKDMGANGWRTAHNPVSPALLDATDRLGLMVWAENHKNRVDGEFLDDMKSMVLRDRNHPSIIIWSLCNEALCESWNKDSASLLIQTIKSLDPDGGRPVSAGINIWPNQGFDGLLDLMGMNYNYELYAPWRAQNPNKAFIGSETASCFTDRSVYNDDWTKAYVSAMQTFWPHREEDSWCPTHNDWVTGGFAWTGFDYKGEPYPYRWPDVNSHFGAMDLCGFPKDLYYYWQARFFEPTVRPVLHVFPHWTWSIYPGARLQVPITVHTNADAVEIFVNNASYGLKYAAIESGTKSFKCRAISWSIPYNSGTLEARAYRNGSKEVFAREVIETVDQPAAVLLELEWPTPQDLKADGAHVALVTAKVVDGKNRVVPIADNLLTFAVEGEAKIIGLGNGDPACHEADKPDSPEAGSRSAFMGLARLVLQTTDTAGAVGVTVTSKGLAAGRIDFKTAPSNVRRY